MKKIILERGKGKTRRLIEMCAEAHKDKNRNPYIVCASKTEAARIRAIAQEMKMEISLPITFAEFINEDNRRFLGIHREVEFFIDQADQLLSIMAGRVGTLRAITIDDDEQVLHKGINPDSDMWAKAACWK